MFVMVLYNYTRQEMTYKGPTGPITTDRDAVAGWEDMEEAERAASEMRSCVSLGTDIWLETR